MIQSTVSMLQEFFIPKVRKMRSIVFQQDGAPPHFAADVRLFLDKTFPGRWIGRGGLIQGAPRPSDLTPLDFFLWGLLKNVVYLSPCEYLAELKSRIHDEIKSILQKTLFDVFSDISKSVFELMVATFSTCCK